LRGLAGRGLGMYRFVVQAFFFCAIDTTNY
jgi:hypothetical protein